MNGSSPPSRLPGRPRCGRCGYDCDPGDANCSRCGADLATARPPSADELRAGLTERGRTEMVRGSVDDAEKEEDRRQRVLRGIVQDSIIGATLFGLAVGFFGSAGRSVGLLLHLVCGAAAGAALTPAWADRGRGAAIFGLGALLAAALSGDLALVGPALLVRLLVLGAAGSLLGHNRSLGRTGG